MKTYSVVVICNEWEDMNPMTFYIQVENKNDVVREAKKAIAKKAKFKNWDDLEKDTLQIEYRIFEGKLFYAGSN